VSTPERENTRIELPSYSKKKHNEKAKLLELYCTGEPRQGHVVLSESMAPSSKLMTLLVTLLTLFGAWRQSP